MKKINSEQADVLFIYPPLHRLYGERKQWMPLSILCLATYLTINEVKAKAYNADCDLQEPEKILSYTDRFESAKFFQKNLTGENYIWEEVRSVLMDISPKIVGISIMTEALGSVQRTVNIIRLLLPNTIIIGGGPHAEIDPDFLINQLGFDYIVKGDGEETLRQLCTDILDGKISSHKKEISEKIIESVRVPLCQLPIPELETHYHYDIYKKVGKKLNITTSRGGCPYSCSFCYCSKYKYTLRFFSPDRVVQEIRHHIDHYNTKKVFFVDDTFTLNKEYIFEVCEKIINEKIHISWTCTTRVGQVNAKMLVLMKKAGCKSIHLGIESGSPRILRLLNKQIDFRMVEESVKMIKDSGIECRMFFMAGLPTESSQDLLCTQECIRRFEPEETILDIYVPIPGTKLFEYICNMGVDLYSIDWCSFRRDHVPYHLYINNNDGMYDLELQNLFMLVEEMNNRKG